MVVRVAINGFGRIGRAILRAVYENKREDIEVVAINMSGSLATNAHLTKYDTVHGVFQQEVGFADNCLQIGSDSIKTFATRDINTLPWQDIGVDVVLECTGAYRTRELASQHLKQGAGKVIISAPAKGEVDATVVYGVNQNTVKSDAKVISAASCTTNCLAPIAKVIHDSFGIRSGLLTTVHAYTNDQNLLDVNHKDLRRARAAGMSIIPTSTGAADAIGLVLPELEGKLTGYAVRVPVANVSMLDLSLQLSKKATAAEVNSTLASAVHGMSGVLVYNELPLVSADFNHSQASSIFDATQTKVIDNLVKVVAWYDNEWGFANRMLDLAKHIREEGRGVL